MVPIGNTVALLYDQQYDMVDHLPQDKFHGSSFKIIFLNIHQSLFNNNYENDILITNLCH